MASNPDFPDPNGPKPAGISDSAWRAYHDVDSTKPLSWWQAQDKYLVPGATGYERYRSAKVDDQGNPIQGLVEHPDSLPPGWTAWGQSGAKRIDSPEVQAAWNPQSALPSTAQPQASPTQSPTDQSSPLIAAILKALGLNSQGQQQAPTQPQSSGSPLQDMLMQGIGQGTGLFSLPNGREGGRSGKGLVNGGLLWSEDGNVGNWGAPDHQAIPDGPWGIPTTSPVSPTLTNIALPQSQPSYTPPQTPTAPTWSGATTPTSSQPFQIPSWVTPTQQQQQDIANGQAKATAAQQNNGNWQSYAQQQNPYDPLRQQTKPQTGAGISAPPQQGNYSTMPVNGQGQAPLPTLADAWTQQMQRASKGGSAGSTAPQRNSPYGNIG